MVYPYSWLVSLLVIISAINHGQTQMINHYRPYKALLNQYGLLSATGLVMVYTEMKLNISVSLISNETYQLLSITYILLLLSS